MLTAVSGEQTAEGIWQKMRSNQDKEGLWCHLGTASLLSSVLKRFVISKRAKQTLSHNFPGRKRPAWILGVAEKLQCC